MAETFWLSTKEDHIAPFASTLSGLNMLKSPFEFVLGESGHVAGIFNPAQSTKYGFTAKDNYQAGSWWPYWLEWIMERSGTLKKYTPAPELYPSPGNYVKNSR
jgi:polyhydroxyalkanoate synthase